MLATFQTPKFYVLPRLNRMKTCEKSPKIRNKVWSSNVSQFPICFLSIFHTNFARNSPQLLRKLLENFLYPSPSESLLPSFLFKFNPRRKEGKKAKKPVSSCFFIFIIRPAESLSLTHFIVFHAHLRMLLFFLNRE